VVSATLRPLYPPRIDPVPIVQEAGFTLKYRDIHSVITPCLIRAPFLGHEEKHTVITLLGETPMLNSRATARIQGVNQDIVCKFFSVWVIIFYFNVIHKCYYCLLLICPVK
jgi:hypothetical protein